MFRIKENRRIMHTSTILYRKLRKWNNYMTRLLKLGPTWKKMRKYNN
jgi:hypothetical protein